MKQPAGTASPLSTSFDGLLPASIHSSFLDLARTESGAAQRGLEAYVAQVCPLDDTRPLTAKLTTTRDVVAQKLALHCEFHGEMSPEQYRKYEQQLTESLSAHPVLSEYQPMIKCARGAEGKICLEATVGGLSENEYKNLIESLADLQYMQDNFETNSGFRHENAHHVHEKMITATSNLKILTEQYLKGQGPDFTLKLEKTCGRAPGLIGLDLRIEGLADRTQAVPVMGALTRAFRMKRRKGMINNGISADDPHGDLSGGDSSIHIDDLTPHGFHELLDDLARPLATIFSGTNHHGKVQPEPPTVNHFPEGTH